tara:strand:+ start:8899 stop:9828 length:930 start_codon:yes stop_codon:yes gene_type:complete
MKQPKHICCYDLILYTEYAKFNRKCILNMEKCNRIEKDRFLTNTSGLTQILIEGTMVTLLGESGGCHVGKGCQPNPSYVTKENSLSQLDYVYQGMHSEGTIIFLEIPDPAPNGTIPSHNLHMFASTAGIGTLFVDKRPAVLNIPGKNFYIDIVHKEIAHLKLHEWDNVYRQVIEFYKFVSSHSQNSHLLQYIEQYKQKLDTLRSNIKYALVGTDELTPHPWNSKWPCYHFHKHYFNALLEIQGSIFDIFVLYQITGNLQFKKNVVVVVGDQHRINIKKYFEVNYPGAVIFNKSGDDNTTNINGSCVPVK